MDEGSAFPANYSIVLPGNYITRTTKHFVRAKDVFPMGKHNVVWYVSCTGAAVIALHGRI